MSARNGPAREIDVKDAEIGPSNRLHVQGSSLLAETANVAALVSIELALALAPKGPSR